MFMMNNCTKGYWKHENFAYKGYNKCDALVGHDFPGKRYILHCLSFQYFKWR